MKRIISFFLVILIFSNSMMALAATDNEIYGSYNLLNHQIDNTVLSGYSNVHPKLHINSSRLSTVKKKISRYTDDILSNSYSKLIAHAGWGVSNLPPASITTNVYDDAFSYAYDYVPSLALAYKLSDKQEYLDAAWTWLNQFCEYPSWESYPDLATGIGLTFMSLAYDWLYNDLTEAQRSKIKAKLLEQGQIVYDYFTEAKGSHTRTWMQNHTWIPISGMTYAALALYGEDTAVEPWLQRGVKHMSACLSWMPDDGAFHEGMDYFFYGMESFFAYADMAKTILGIDAFTTNFFKNLPDYLLNSMYPEAMWSESTQYSTIGDSTGAGTKTHMFRLLAGKLNNGYMQWLANKYDFKDISSAHPYYSIVWYNESVYPIAPDATTKPLLKHFEDLDIVYSRTGWGIDEDMLIFKSGLPLGHKEYEASKSYSGFYDLGGAHVHPDNNHFILIANGETLLRDDNYTVPKHTFQHNTLTVDDIGQAGDKERWFDTMDFHSENGYAQIKKAESYDGIDYIVGDAADSYRASAGVTKFNRHLIHIKPDILIVADDIKLNKKGTMKLRFWPESQDITETSNGFLVNTAKNTMLINNLSENCGNAGAQTETVCKREETEERKSILYTKNDSSWENLTAVTWTSAGSELPKVECIKNGDDYIISTDEKQITLSLQNEEIQVKDYYSISTTIEGSGTADIPDGTKIVSGDKLTAVITPENGCYIESITINGNTVVSNHSGAYTLETVITGNSDINIVFKPNKPLVNTFKNTFDAPGYGGVIFGQLINYDSTVKEYGIVFSATNPEPRINEFDCQKFRSLLGFNANGYYGIQLKGNGVLAGLTYFAVPYVIYENDDGTKTTSYGERIAFTPQSVVINSFLNSYGYGNIPFTSYEAE